MSLRDIDRKLVEYSISVVLEHAEIKEAPFSRVVPWLAIARACKLIPRISDQAQQQFRVIFQSNDFNVEKAAVCMNILRADMLPQFTDLVVKVVSCPLIESSEQNTCLKEAGSPGCDACAGKKYYAKTDGETIWIAAALFQPQYRYGGAEFLAMGDIKIPSLTEFVMIHEFAHIMQGVGRYFDPAVALYNEAKAMIPAELITQKRIVANDTDALEFAASSFAYESTRSDRGARANC